ncbi:hypothetical protein BKA59DRAFT_198439 [Fusarium tricinctum]|uniref:Uncharacterized protein n=1 Tax=Fusarium tricinctum TaxID=61284 RepID=A0A8K0S166_9HYPO|nr:hypothetical protein BKA59DRAFT_198439 [Fusarium tricinctum]
MASGSATRVLSMTACIRKIVPSLLVLARGVLVDSVLFFLSAARFVSRLFDLFFFPFPSLLGCLVIKISEGLTQGTNKKCKICAKGAARSRQRHNNKNQKLLNKQTNRLTTNLVVA